jgi:hypothetical protein
MLLPYKRICRNLKQRLEVVRTQWAQFEKLSTQDRLPIE